MNSINLKPEINPPDIFACGSVQMDIDGEPIGEPNGAKVPARVTLGAGGCPVNIARTVRRPGLRTVVFGVQHTAIHPWITAEIRRLGATPLIRRRDDVVGASVMLPCEDDEGRKLLVQRARLRRADFDESVCDLIAAAGVAVVGPIADTSDETFDILRLVPSLAQRSVLIPHPKLVTDSRFGAIASGFDCVMLNSNEAAALTPGHKEIEFAALRLRYLTEGGVEFLITNGKRHGLMWANRHWHTIVPHKVECADDVGAGDTFAGNYIEARFVRGLPVRIALDRALAAAALFLQQRARNGLPPRRKGNGKIRGPFRSLFERLLLPCVDSGWHA